MMAREIGEHPPGRSAPLRQDRAQLDERPVGQLAAAHPLRLQHAEKAARMKVGDRLVGQPAQILARLRPRA
jgi:hypothetical protein